MAKQASRYKLPAGKNNNVVFIFIFIISILTDATGDLAWFRLAACSVFVNVISQERIGGITSNFVQISTLA